LGIHLNPTQALNPLLNHSQCRLSPHSPLPIPQIPLAKTRPKFHNIYHGHKCGIHAHLKHSPPPPQSIPTVTNNLTTLFFTKRIKTSKKIRVSVYAETPSFLYINKRKGEKNEKDI
jgi:hypothetical protein